MPKSDPVRPPRLRDIGGAKASDRTAFALGLVLAVLLALATLWLTRAVLEERIEEVAILAQEGAHTLASAVADDFAAAIDLGIPLDRARGVTPYLEGTLQSDTLVSEIGILDLSEKVLFRVPAHARLEGTVRAAIVVDGERQGSVVVTPSSQILDRSREHLLAIAVAISLVLSVALAVVLRLAALERLNLPQARLGASAGAAARGVYADFTPPLAGPLRPLGQAAVRLTSPLRRRHRQLMEMTDEVRALDTSGRLSGRISAALAPLAGLVFDRPMVLRPPATGRLWWPLAALTVLLAARPLVTSFAADRVGEASLAAIFMALTMAAFALGALLGLVLSGLPPLRGTKAVSIVGMLVTAGALGITLVLRDPRHFVLAQFLAGLFGVWAIGAVFQTDGAGERRPWRAALVLLPAIAVGMPLGALLAEAEGRRLAFATIGGAAVLVALAALAGPPRRPRPRAAGRPVAPALLVAAAAVSLAIAGFVELTLAPAYYRENYAGLALATALIGAASLPLPALLARRVPALAITGAALAGLALLAKFFGVPAPAAAILLGLALGGVVAGLGARALGGRAAAAFLCGILLAALGKLFALFMWLPFLPVAGIATLALAALSLLLLLLAKGPR